MMKLGPGGGTMEAHDNEKTPFSELFTFDKREQDNKVEYVMRGPFSAELRAELLGDDNEKTLRFTKMLRSGGDNTTSDTLIMLKGLIVAVQNELEGEQMKLARIELPLAEAGLRHLLVMPEIGELFGADQVEAAYKFHNPTREEEERRRAGDPKPGTVSLTLEEMTEHLKQFESRHGTIRQ